MVNIKRHSFPGVEWKWRFTEPHLGILVDRDRVDADWLTVSEK